MALAFLIDLTAPAWADNPTPLAGTRVIKTSLPYAKLINRLENAMKANRMGLVTRASATMGAHTIGIKNEATW